MADPYRSSGGNACPQCATPLAFDELGGAAPCPNGCGAWLPVAYIAQIFDIAEIARESRDLEQAEALHYAPPPCPICAAPLVRAWLDTAPVRSCAEHGLWVAAPSAARFDAQLAAPMARHRRLLELAALLGSADEASRRAIARRILVLEDQVAELEAALRQR